MRNHFRPAVTTLETRAVPSYVVSVTQFGAFGNGFTDCAPAIQAAINSVPATGGTVVFPPGFYEVSRSIVLNKSNTTLIGAGPASSMIQLLPGVQTYALIVTNTHDDIVTQLWVDSHHNGIARLYAGIFIEGCNQVNVNHCQVSNFPFIDILVGGAQSYNTVIWADRLYGYGAEGLAITDANNTIVAGCTFINTPRFSPWGFQVPIDLEPDPGAADNGVLIEYCTFNAPRSFSSIPNVVYVAQQWGPVTNAEAIDNIVNGIFIPFQLL
jgi:hypothetical protein